MTEYRIKKNWGNSHPPKRKNEKKKTKKKYAKRGEEIPVTMVLIELRPFFMIIFVHVYFIWRARVHTRIPTTPSSLWLPSSPLPSPIPSSSSSSLFPHPPVVAITVSPFFPSPESLIIFPYSYFNDTIASLTVVFSRLKLIFWAQFDAAKMKCHGHKIYGRAGPIKKRECVHQKLECDFF